jgi:hypothetical protein
MKEDCLLFRSHTRHPEGIFAYFAPLRALRETGTLIVMIMMMGV